MLMFFAWFALIASVAALIWAAHGLFCLQKTNKIISAYIDWKFEDYEHVDERSEPLSISDLFDQCQLFVMTHSDPFMVFSDQNREQFRQWFQERYK